MFGDANERKLVQQRLRVKGRRRGAVVMVRNQINESGIRKDKEE